MSHAPLDLKSLAALAAIAMAGACTIYPEDLLFDTPVFHPLPSLDTADVADVLQVIRIRLLNLLEPQGVIEDRSELTLLDDGLAEREPALAQLAAAAVSGLPPSRSRTP